MNKYLSIAIILLPLQIALSQQIEFLNDGEDIVHDIALKDTSILASLTKQKVVIWNLQNNELIHRHYPTKNDFTCLDISKDGTLLALGDKSGLVKILRIDNNDIQYTHFFDMEGAITDISFDGPGQRVALSFISGAIGIWSFSEEAPELWNAHKKNATAVCFNSNAAFLASGGSDGKIKIWDSSNHEEKINIKAHKSWIHAIIWCEDDSKIISSGEDGKIISIENISNFSQEPHVRRNFTWSSLTGIDYIPRTKSLVSITLYGLVMVNFPFGIYKYNTNYNMFSVKVIPYNDERSHIAVGTNGKGVMLIDSTIMRFEKL